MARYRTRKPLEDLAARFHITTPERHREMAEKIGDGNVSLGFRKAVEFYMQQRPCNPVKKSDNIVLSMADKNCQI